MALGTIGLLAWALHVPRLQSLFAGSATMKANTAACFLAAGLALWLQRWPGAAARGAAAVAALGVLALGTLTALAYLTGLDAGADDWLVRAPALLFPEHGEPPESPVGRMALATALAFVLVAVSLLLDAAARHRVRVAMAARAAARAVLAIGAVCVAGHLLDVDFLHSFFAFGAVAAHTAGGLVVLGAGLLAGGRAAPWATRPLSADARIAWLAAWMVVLAAGATGVVSFAALQSQVRQALAQGLQFAHADRVARLATTVEYRSNHAALVADDPRLREHLRAAHGAAPAAARQALAAALGDLLPHGFSALTVETADGETIAAGVALPAAVAHAVPLAGRDGAELVWHDDDFYLRHRLPLHDATTPLGTLRTEQRLPALGPALRRAEGAWTTADFVLCKPTAAAFACFPTRLHGRPLTLPLTSPDQPLLIQVTHREGRGFHSGFDYRGRRVLGAGGPVADLGLIALLKVDAAEIYRPITRQFLIAMALVALLAGAGAIAVRRWLRPMAGALEQQVGERTAAWREAEEALRRAHDELEQRVAARTAELARATAAAARLAAIVESSDDAIYSCDGDGVVTSWNSGAERLYGYPAAAIVGRSLELLGAGPDLGGGALDGGGAVRLEAVHRRRDGSTVDVSLVLSPLRDAAGAPLGTAAIARDVSAAKRQERRIVAALHEKEVLLQEVHHRVKNNLQVMASLLDLQRRTAEVPAVRDAMEEAADRIASIALLHDKLYRAHDLGQIDVVEYLRDLAERLLHQHDRDDGRVRLEVSAAAVRLGVDQAIPCGLIANELVTNALKYAFVGRDAGTIRLGIERETDGGIHLLVADDGIGLPGGVDLRHGATLGLQLVGTFVDQLDGTIALDRRDGTRFDVRFRAHA